MPRKNTAEKVRQILLDNGCELLCEYESSKTPMLFRCKCGDIGKKTLSNFYKHPYCSLCGEKINRSQHRLSYDYVQSQYKERGLTLLESEFKNSSTKMKYKCSCGNIHSATYNDIQQGTKCKHCQYIRVRQTLSKHGNTPTSYQQEQLYKLFGGEMNYCVDMYSLDIAFPNEKIYIEYDGSGHRLSVDTGSVNADTFDSRERKRNYYLKRRGWKCFRIISDKDKLPLPDTLKSLFNEAIALFKDNASYFTVNIDEQIVEYGNQKYARDFGETQHVSKKSKNKWMCND